MKVNKIDQIASPSLSQLQDKEIEAEASPKLDAAQVGSDYAPISAEQAKERASRAGVASSVAHKTPASSEAHVRSLASDEANWGGFSADPAKLSALLTKEILEVQKFVSGLKDAFSFFGGARVRPHDAHFAAGEKWGEAVLLTNVAAKSPKAISLAAGSGLFSKEAVNAASAVALGCAVGFEGPGAVTQSLANCGGASSKDAIASAIVEAQAGDTNPEDLGLLMTLTRTGAGPGMMEAVPIGYLDARKKLMRLMPELGPALTEGLVTQGSRIELPFEQAPNPYIEKMREFAHFLPRRLALTEQANGFVVFPGGVGTLNELFEVVRHGRPTVLCSSEFYSGMLKKLTEAWTKRDLVDPDVFKNLKVVDGPTEGLPHLLERAKASPPAPEPSHARAMELATDLQRGLETLTKLPSAVTFIGGHRLKDSDPEIPVAQDLAARLTKSGVPVRAGGDGAVLNAVSDGARSVRPGAKIQGLLLERGDEDFDNIHERLDVCEVVHSTAAHKVLMYENADAIVALPGGVGTFDEIFELVTLMQCEKIPKRPLILVGSEFWKPFLDEMARVMLDKDSNLPEDKKLKTISDEDMDMFQVVDDAADAARIIRLHLAKQGIPST
jgi:uncharacterized protein (TIGR00730 family)